MACKLNSDETMGDTLKHKPFPGSDKTPSHERKCEVVDLEGICLSVIISNFDIYIRVFNQEPDGILKDHFEFLARRYSEILFTAMKRKRILQPEYFDFLINPHLKVLDIVNIESHLLQPLLDRIKRGNNILHYKAHSKDLDEAESEESLISCLQSVDIIEYKGVVIDSTAFIRSIRKNCPHLRVLLLDRRGLYDMSSYKNAIADLITGCPCLEILHSADTVGALYKMYTFKFLFMRKKNNITLKKSKKYNLKTLSSERSLAEKYSLSDALEVCAVICPNVSCLCMDHVNGEKELEKCLLFPLLEDITFEKLSNITSRIWNNFLNLTGNKLIGLDLPYEKWLSLPDLTESCPNLQSLKLRCRSYSDPGEEKLSEELPYIARFSHLTELKVECADFRCPKNAEALKLVLAVAKGITKLSLKKCCGLTNELFARCLNLYYIQELDLSWSDIEGLINLEDKLLHGRLQKLDLSYCVNINSSD